MTTALHFLNDIWGNEFYWENYPPRNTQWFIPQWIDSSREERGQVLNSDLSHTNACDAWQLFQLSSFQCSIREMSTCRESLWGWMTLSIVILSHSKIFTFYLVDINKEVNWGKLKIVKKESLFRNGRRITTGTSKL